MSASTETVRAASAASDEVVLRDGTRAEIMPMHRTDAGRLVRFHHTLSPETRRLRFFTFHPELSPKELHRFTHVDHHDREALVAVIDDEIVAVARFDRLAAGADAEAEAAFVVADSWQGRGLGTLLFQALASRARAVGIARFHADTLGENHRMLKVFLHAGLPVRQHFEDSLVHLTLELGTESPAS